MTSEPLAGRTLLVAFSRPTDEWRRAEQRAEPGFDPETARVIARDHCRIDVFLAHAEDADLQISGPHYEDVGVLAVDVEDGEQPEDAAVRSAVAFAEVLARDFLGGNTDARPPWDWFAAAEAASAPLGRPLAAAELQALGRTHEVSGDPVEVLIPFLRDELRSR